MKPDFNPIDETASMVPDRVARADSRKPWAIAASMAVLIFGSLFLLVSATAPIHRTVVVTRVSDTATIPSPLPEPAPPTLITSTPNDTGSFAPEVTPTKPLLVAALPSASTPAPAPTESGFAPRLKPRAATPPAPAGAGAPGLLHTNPINLQPLLLASPLENPPAFFAEPDPLAVHRSDAIPAGDITTTPEARTLSLKRGETLVDLLARANIRREDRNAAASAIGKHLKLRQLQPGMSVDLTLDAPNQTWFQATMANTDTPEVYLISLEVRADEHRELILKRTADGIFNTLLTPVKMTKRLHAISGHIDGNLYVSMRREGAPGDVIHNLANIFAYDVDFQRDIFLGDSFEAIFEVWYDEDGTIVRGGDILFAKLAWRGRSRTKGYYLYDPKSKTLRADYFDADGKSARRLLMKNPIDGARLSSRFGPRKHPILGYRKTHKGVDFAARRGTPIKATGDGVIERANRYGSFGNYVRIRHANGYKTAYAHLKGFARKTRKGRRVRQGDIIGYVGTTGRSTGPHLHYEVHLKGRAINPQKLKIATGTKLSARTLDGFKGTRDALDRLRSAAQSTPGATPGVSANPGQSAITGK